MMDTDIVFQRRHYTQTLFEKNFPPIESNEIAIKSWITSKCSPKSICSKEYIKGIAMRKLPFIGIMKKYKFREWILRDLIAGLSIAVIHVPQGLGFALLTSVSPVYGLYTSLFPTLFYFFFGTSLHNSLGTMSLISLMIGAAVEREVPTGGVDTSIVTTTPSSTHLNISENIEFNYDMRAINIATSITLMSGLFQILLSLLHLGSIATFMSMAFINGFMAGSAFHIVTSQLPVMLGLSLPPVDDYFQVPIKIYHICKLLPLTNVADLIITLCSVLFLILVKEVLNEKFKHKLKIPIPAELILVIIGILASHFGNLENKFDVRTVGLFPSGFIEPREPPVGDHLNLIGDAFSIAIVSFAITISMSKMLSRKHGYPIDDNQELFALGISFGLSSFFHCFGGAQAPPRTLTQESTGGKTQVAGLFSCVIVLLVCLVMAPLFQPLPVALLASIIVVAIFPLFRLFSTLKQLWKVSRYDFATWIVTCLFTLFISVVIGIAVGISFSLLTIVFQAYFVKGFQMHKATDGIYRNPNKYRGLNNIHGFEIYKFEGPLFFANAGKFKENLILEVNSVIQSYPHVRKAGEPKPANQNGTTKEEHKSSAEGAHELDEEITSGDLGSSNLKIVMDMDGEMGEVNVTPLARTQSITSVCSELTVVLDCSALSYIDMQGLNTLTMIRDDCKQSDLRFALAECSDHLLAKIKAQDLAKDLEIYMTIQDAISGISNHSADGRQNNTSC